MSTLLITGGSGFVGGRLSQALAARGHNVLAGTRNPGKRTTGTNGNIQPVNHADLLGLDSFPAVDEVIHLAALNEWDCVSNPSEAVRVNVDEKRVILDNAIARGVRRFIYFSTAHVYGSPLQGTLTELAMPDPRHPYAVTHLAAEHFVLAAGRSGKIRSLVFRLSNAFGAPVSPDVNRWTLLASDLARQAVEKKSVTLLSNGCQWRDFICLGDVAAAVVFAVEGGDLPADLYNLGSGSAVRVIDMAGTIAAAAGAVLGFPVAVRLPDNLTPTEERGLHFSVDRLKQAGFRPTNDVDEELRELLLFCRTHFTP